MKLKKLISLTAPLIMGMVLLAAVDMYSANYRGPETKIFAASTDTNEEYLLLGYCDGNIPDANDSKSNYGKIGKGLIDVAINFSQEEMSKYDQGQVTAIKVGFSGAAMPQNDLTIWVRNELNGQNIVSKTIDATELQPGWNEIVFDSPYTIDGAQQLYAGFSFTQEKRSNCISLGGETFYEGCWIGKEGVWGNISDKLAGSLCIEAKIQGDAIPQQDMKLMNCKLDRKRADHNHNLQLSGRIKNVGAGRIEGFCIDYHIGDFKGTTPMQPVSLGYREYAEFNVEIPTDNVDDFCGDMIIDIRKTDGAADDQPNDNTLNVPLVLADKVFEAKVLLEEFTSEYCSGCPSTSQSVEEILKSDKEIEDITIWTCHHAGYKTDYYSIPESEDYVWLFGGSSYNPGFMFNRTFPQEYYSDPNFQDPSPVVGLRTAEEVKHAIKLMSDAKASVALNVTNINLKDGKLSFTVEVEKNSMFYEEVATPLLTVFITETDLKPVYVSSSCPDDFLHHHAVRAITTPTWGEEMIGWNEDKFSKTFEIDLNTTWNLDKLSVTAFVSEYNPEDISECVVYNSVRQSLDESTGGVNEVCSDKEVIDVRFYTIDGILLEGQPSQNGTYIRVENYSNGTSNAKKIYVR